MAAKGKVKQALQDLTVIHPFWATLVLHMELIERKKDDPMWANNPQPTFATDGKRIYYSPEFAESLSLGLNMFALAHEAGHPMFHHLSRILKYRPGSGKIFGYRDGKPLYYHPKLWNIAGDHVINLALKDCGFEIWKQCCCDPRFKDMTTEEIYSILEKEHMEQCPGCNGQGGPGAQCPIASDPITGDDIMAPAGDFSEDEIKEIVTRAAAIAKSQGKLPASLEGLIKEATEPQYPMYLLLERFIDTNIKDDDHTFHIPNRRTLPYGVITPSPFADKIANVVIIYDTSGSVPDEDLSRFHRITGDIIRKLAPQRTTVIQCDASVKHEATRVFENGNLQEWGDIASSGRGGTDFRPPFEYIKEQNIKPSCCIYLTDMAGTFPEMPPDYPMFWASTEKGSEGPFGMTVYLNQ